MTTSPCTGRAGSCACRGLPATTAPGELYGSGGCAQWRGPLALVPGRLGLTNRRPVGVRRRRELRFAVLHAPQAEAADEGVGVVAGARARRQFLQLADVAAAQHDVLRLQGGPQPLHHVRDTLPPFLAAQ